MTVLSVFFPSPGKPEYIVGTENYWQEIDVGFICLSKTFSPTTDSLLSRGGDPVAIEKEGRWMVVRREYGEIGVKTYRHQTSLNRNQESCDDQL